MVTQKTDGRYIAFTQALNDWEVDLVILGTSHSDLADIRGDVHIYNLSSPHNVPTVMYFKAKTIIKSHPEVKTIYLEADDHLFFNGTYYNLDGFDPVQKRNSKIFEWNAAYIDSDDEKEKIFGNVAPYSQDKLMLLKEDVKPVIIKRVISNSLAEDVKSKPADAPVEQTRNFCDFSVYPDTVEISKESIWSARTQQDKQQRMLERLEEHKLNSVGPLKDIQVEYYEKTIQLFLENNINVVLVFNPETSEFVQMKNPEGQKLHRDFIEKLAKKYQLRILDMQNLSKHGDRVFQDQDHIDGSFGWLVGRSIMQDFCSAQANLTR